MEGGREGGRMRKKGCKEPARKKGWRGTGGGVSSVEEEDDDQRWGMREGISWGI